MTLSKAGFNGWDGEQRSVVTGGVKLADRLIADLDPGVRGEGIGAHPGTPGGPAAVRAAVQGRGDRALQATLTRAVQADRDDRLAGGEGLLFGGWSGAAAGQFQHGAQPPGPQTRQRPGRTYGEQGQRPVPYRESGSLFQGHRNGHDGVTSFAARS